MTQVINSSAFKTFTAEAGVNATFTASFGASVTLPTPDAGGTNKALTVFNSGPSAIAFAFNVPAGFTLPAPTFVAPSSWFTVQPGQTILFDENEPEALSTSAFLALLAGGTSQVTFQRGATAQTRLFAFPNASQNVSATF